MGTAWQALANKVKKSLLVPLTDHERLLLDYFKTRLEVGNVYSIKCDLIETVALPESIPRLAMADLADCVVESHDDVCDADPSYQPGLSFFEVVCNRPERKVGHSISVMAERAHIIFVKFLTPVANRLKDVALSLNSGGTCALDLRPWMLPDNIRQVLGSLLCWTQVTPGNRPRLAADLQHAPLAFGIPLAPDMPVDDNGNLSVLEAGSGDADYHMALQRFIDKGALVGTNTTLSLLDMSGVHADTLQCFVELGVVERFCDEFDDVSYQLQPHAIRFQSFLRAASPEHELLRDRNILNLSQLTKIELLVVLIVQGFLLSSTPALPPLLRTHCLELLPGNLMRSSSYFKVLVNHSAIFEKVGDFGIEHSMPMHYYECLAKLPKESLQELLARPNLHSMLDSEFRAVLTGSGVQLQALLAPEESVHLQIMQLEDVQQPEEQEAGDFVPNIALFSVPAELPNRRVRRGLDYPEILVKFDNCSHRHGHQRCYVQCAQHTRCFKYTQLRFFQNIDHCIAWLYEWWRLSDRDHNMSRERHKYALPADSEVEGCFLDMFGHWPPNSAA